MKLERRAISHFPNQNLAVPLTGKVLRGKYNAKPPKPLYRNRSKSQRGSVYGSQKDEYDDENDILS